jgi:hypothetical protein
MIRTGENLKPIQQNNLRVKTHYNDLKINLFKDLNPILIYLATYATGVGLDTRVKPHVPSQHVGAGEGAVAEVTHMR